MDYDSQVSHGVTSNTTFFSSASFSGSVFSSSATRLSAISARELCSAHWSCRDCSCALSDASSSACFFSSSSLLVSALFAFSSSFWMRRLFSSWSCRITHDLHSYRHLVLHAHLQQLALHLLVAQLQRLDGASYG